MKDAKGLFSKLVDLKGYRSKEEEQEVIDWAISTHTISKGEVVEKVLNLGSGGQGHSFDKGMQDVLIGYFLDGADFGFVRMIYESNTHMRLRIKKDGFVYDVSYPVKRMNGSVYLIVVDKPWYTINSELIKGARRSLLAGYDTWLANNSFSIYSLASQVQRTSDGGVNRLQVKYTYPDINVKLFEMYKSSITSESKNIGAVMDDMREKSKPQEETHSSPLDDLAPYNLTKKLRGTHSKVDEDIFVTKSNKDWKIPVVSADDVRDVRDVVKSNVSDVVDPLCAAKKITSGTISTKNLKTVTGFEMAEKGYIYLDGGFFKPNGDGVDSIRILVKLLTRAIDNDNVEDAKVLNERIGGML